MSLEKKIVSIKIQNKSKHSLPKQTHKGDAGFDVRANIDSSINVSPSERVLIPTGLFFDIPEGYEIQVRPRSGLAIKKGITVLNSPGTIDCYYKDEAGVILINHSKEEFTIEDGDRIAQFVISEIPLVELKEVDEISKENDRGGGFGHSGIK